jgi:type I restriction enzyme S subunit
MAEQRRIVEEAERLLTMADAVEESVKRQMARGSRLRQSILRWAFEGKLVNQDPNEEPACMALDRIRAEKAAAGMPESRTRCRIHRPRIR